MVFAWVQFEQRCQGSIFKTTLKVLPVVGAICIAKIDDSVSSRAGSQDFDFEFPLECGNRFPDE